MEIPKFIIFEGVDGSGTTTQATFLAGVLRTRGFRVHQTREPSVSRIGKLVREELTDSDDSVNHDSLALLFAADRLDHVRRVIQPALARGEIVICDRYLLSSIAYQGLNCDPEWVASINRFALWPDLQIFLDVDADCATERVRRRLNVEGGKRERFEHYELQKQLVESYRELAENYPEVVQIDGGDTMGKVNEKVLEICDGLGMRNSTSLT